MLIESREYVCKCVEICSTGKDVLVVLVLVLWKLWLEDEDVMMIGIIRVK
jgi:hypothetical protein